MYASMAEVLKGWWYHPWGLLKRLKEEAGRPSGPRALLALVLDMAAFISLGEKGSSRPLESESVGRYRTVSYLYYHQKLWSHDTWSWRGCGVIAAEMSVVTVSLLPSTSNHLIIGKLAGFEIQVLIHIVEVESVVLTNSWEDVIMACIYLPLGTRILDNRNSHWYAVEFIENWRVHMQSENDLNAIYIGILCCHYVKYWT